MPRASGSIHISKSALELFKSAFFYSADVRAGDVQPFCYLLLSQWLLASETVPKGDYAPLTGSEQGVHQPKRLFSGYLPLNVVGQRVVTAYNVDIRQGITLLVNVYGVIERDLAGKLLACSEMHKYLVRYPHLTAR